MSSSQAEKVELILEEVVKWAETLYDIYAFSLVGSRARGTARRDLEIDLIILTSNLSGYRKSQTWLDLIDWQKVGSPVKDWKDVDYGLAWSGHVYLEDETEIELGFGSLKWASIDPIDTGSFRVVSDGCRIVYDSENLMNKLLAEVKSTRNN